MEDIRKNGAVSEKDNKKFNYDFENYICVAEKKDDGTYSVKNINKEDFNEEEQLKLLAWSNILPSNPKISDVDKIFKKAHAQVLDSLDDMKKLLFKENQKKEKEVDIKENSVIEIDEAGDEHDICPIEDLVKKNNEHIFENEETTEYADTDIQYRDGDIIGDMFDSMDSPEVLDDSSPVVSEDAEGIDKKMSKSSEYTKKFNEVISENNKSEATCEEEDLATLLQKETIDTEAIPTIIIEPSEGFPVLSSEINTEDIDILTENESNKMTFSELEKVDEDMRSLKPSHIFSPYDNQGYADTLATIYKHKPEENEEYVENIENEIENQQDNAFQSPITPQ